jgi:hypothetical protein
MTCLPPVAPDDTPTRLQQLHKVISENCGAIAGDGSLATPCRNVIYEAVCADVSRLQQENALLKRSLSMLTKQLEQKEAEWEAQRDDERYRDRTSDHD